MMNNKAQFNKYPQCSQSHKGNVVVCPERQTPSAWALGSWRNLETLLSMQHGLEFGAHRIESWAVKLVRPHPTITAFETKKQRHMKPWFHFTFPLHIKCKAADI